MGVFSGTEEFGSLPRDQPYTCGLAFVLFWACDGRPVCSGYQVPEKHYPRCFFKVLTDPFVYRKALNVINVTNLIIVITIYNTHY